MKLFITSRSAVYDYWVWYIMYDMPYVEYVIIINKKKLTCYWKQHSFYNFSITVLAIITANMSSTYFYVFFYHWRSRRLCNFFQNLVKKKSEITVPISKVNLKRKVLYKIAKFKPRTHLTNEKKRYTTNLLFFM